MKNKEKILLVHYLIYNKFYKIRINQFTDDFSMYLIIYTFLIIIISIVKW